MPTSNKEITLKTIYKEYLLKFCNVTQDKIEQACESMYKYDEFHDFLFTEEYQKSDLGLSNQ
jgi:hypothetical protein